MNSFESKIAGVLVTGIDSGAARSVVPVGETPGYASRGTAKLVVCTRRPPESACSIRRAWELWTAKCEA